MGFLKGPSTQPLQNLETQFADIFGGQQKQSAADIAKRDILTQPAIAFNTALSSGDPNAIFKAIAPELSQISKGTASAKANIMDTVAPGAGRDVALGELSRSTRDVTANAAYQPFLSSFSNLANIGSGYGNFGLNELGAALNAGGSAADLSKLIYQIKQQQQQSTLGMIGSLAATAGQLAAAFA